MHPSKQFIAEERLSPSYTVDLSHYGQWVHVRYVRAALWDLDLVAETLIIL